MFLIKRDYLLLRIYIFKRYLHGNRGGLNRILYHNKAVRYSFQAGFILRKQRIPFLPQEEDLFHSE